MILEISKYRPFSIFYMQSDTNVTFWGNDTPAKSVISQDNGQVSSSKIDQFFATHRNTNRLFDASESLWQVVFIVGAFEKSASTEQQSKLYFQHL